MKIALQIVCLLFSLVSFVHFVPTKGATSTSSVAEALTGVKPTVRPRIEYFVATAVLLAMVVAIQLVWR